QWFGAAPAYVSRPERDITRSWRSCLQLLTAGDFLTPTLIGMTLRDTFTQLASMDRAALLARSIEEHYNAVVFGGSPRCGDDRDERGFCRPFGYLGGESRWLPLLILNSTEVDTGRPVLISDVQTRVTSNCASPIDCTPLFEVAQNAF